MKSHVPVARLFRSREPGADSVAFIELFFDLVFVFAVTQLSHHVIEHLTPRGVLEGTLMLVAVWGVWITTTWVTNLMNPETGPVRWMLISMMLAGLVLSTAIPEAFGDRGLQFALAYVLMQVGRTVFVIVSLRRAGEPVAEFVRVAAWFSLSAPLWIAGAVLGGDAQLMLWAGALAVEMLAPVVGYWLPVLGKGSVDAWQVQGGHMAERAGLFMIIVLGESIIVTGTQFSRGEITMSSVLAALAAFVGTILFWLLYFSHGAEHGHRYITGSERTGRIARLTYTFIHMVLVGGVVLLAVGDELVLAHPDDALDAVTLAIVVAAPALYLLGNMLFKLSTGQPWLRSHLIAMAVLTAVWLVAPAVGGLTPLAMSWIVNLVVACVVIADEYVWRTREIETPGDAEQGDEQGDATSATTGNAKDQGAVLG